MASTDVSISCKAPRGTEAKVKALADRSSLSVNRYLLAILAQAIAEEWIVETKTVTEIRRDRHSPAFPHNRLNEDSLDYAAKKKTAARTG